MQESSPGGAGSPADGNRWKRNSFINEYEPEVRVRADVAAIPDVGGFPAYCGVVVSLFTTGTDKQADGEMRGRPCEDRTEEQAGEEKLNGKERRAGGDAKLHGAVCVAQQRAGTRHGRGAAAKHWATSAKAQIETEK